MLSFMDRWNNIKEEYYRIKAQTYQSTAGGEQSHRAAERIQYEIRNILPEQARKLANEARLLGLKIPEAIAEAAFFSGPDAKSAIYFRHAPKSLTSAAVGAAGAAVDDVREGARAIGNSQWWKDLSNSKFRDFYKGGNK